MNRLSRSRRAVAALAATVAMAAFLLTACTPDDAAPSPSNPSTAAPQPTALPELIVDGTATDNLPFFTHVAQVVHAGPDGESGRSYVDALTEAGFDREAMQLTSDLTSLGTPADSIEFSVRWGEECLVGQFGPEIGEIVTTVLPALSAGRCLVGDTRPIDW